MTREQASIELNMSTRSIDRYIKSGKLRSKKEGKIVYIHQSDIDKILGKNTKQEVIIPQKISSSKEEISQEISHNTPSNGILHIYEDLKKEIRQKDEEIKKLNQDIGRMQEIVKNSISLVDYKKSHFLLEEGKSSLNIELQQTKKELEKKELEIKEERKLNYIMIVVICIIFFMMIGIWFIKI